MPQNTPYTSSSNPVGATATPRANHVNPYDANNHGSRVDHALLSDSATAVAWAGITGKPTEFAATWAGTTGKPTEFAPSSHTHPLSDLSGTGLLSVRLLTGNASGGVAELTGLAYGSVHYNAGGTSVSVTKNNYAATVAPTTTDDGFIQYSVGSRWFDVTADKAYVCVDSTNSAAVWKETTGGGGGGTFDSLTDTTITTIATGDVIKWNGSAYVNNTLAAAGIAAASHTHAATDITETATKKVMTDAERTKLSAVEASATADQSDAEIETGYNNQVGIVSQVDAEAGTATVAERWTPQRVSQAITALGGGAVAKEIGLAVSNEESNLVVGTANLTFRMPYAMTLTAVRASVTTAPTGANIIVDIKESDTTILSTLLSIDATEKTSTTAATAAVISDTALADDAEITVAITQIGSTIPGTGLKIWLIGTLT